MLQWTKKGDGWVASIVLGGFLKTTAKVTPSIAKEYWTAAINGFCVENRFFDGKDKRPSACYAYATADEAKESAEYALSVACAPFVTHHRVKKS